MDRVKRRLGKPVLFFVAAFMLTAMLPGADEATSIHNNQMSVSVAPQGGFYEIASAGSKKPILQAGVGRRSIITG